MQSFDVTSPIATLLVVILQLKGVLYSLHMTSFFFFVELKDGIEVVHPSRPVGVCMRTGSAKLHQCNRP